MPSNYTGDPTGGADDFPVVACPVDGDGRNAESVNVVFRKLADYLAFLRAKCHPSVAGNAELRVLVQEIDDEYGVGLGIKTRIYVNVDGETEITRNARWISGPGGITSKWQADYWNAAWGPQICTKHVISNSGIATYTYGDAAHDLTDPAYQWADAAWLDKVRLNGNGLIRFFDTIWGGSNNSNPEAPEAVKNTLCAKNLPKAWARVSVVTGTVTIVDGFNLAWDSNPDANTIRLKFPAGGTMADANYLVQVKSENGQVNATADQAGRTAGYFDVKGYEFVTPFAAIAINGLGTFKFDVLVFGRQDS